jgi:hypothetical protein
VEVMQRELQDLAPILERTSKEVEDMMVVIAADKQEAGAYACRVCLCGGSGEMSKVAGVLNCEKF